MSPFLSSLSSPLTWPLPPLLSGPCFSHFPSPTFSALLCACPSLPLCHPLPLLFSSFCACVSAMWLNVLSGLCSVCSTWRRRLCGAPAGLDWASSPRWSWHGAARFPSSPGKQMLFSPHDSPLQLLSHWSCRLAFACFVTAENLNLVMPWRRSKGCVDATVVVLVSSFFAHICGSTISAAVRRLLVYMHFLVHACIDEQA